MGAFVAACGHPEPAEGHGLEPLDEEVGLRSATSTALTPVLEASRSAPPKGAGAVGGGGGSG